MFLRFGFIVVYVSIVDGVLLLLIYLAIIILIILRIWRSIQIGGMKKQALLPLARQLSPPDPNTRR
jgi:hypothetical protein